MESNLVGDFCGNFSYKTMYVLFEHELFIESLRD